MDEITADLPVTRCISAEEVRQAYLTLLQTQPCHDGKLCFGDDCPTCGPLNELVDRRGEECEARGCTLARCVYDDPALVR